MTVYRRICEVCNHPFSPRRSETWQAFHERKFCSVDCLVRAGRASALEANRSLLNNYSYRRALREAQALVRKARGAA